jgi:hypothetical protein
MANPRDNDLKNALAKLRGHPDRKLQDAASAMATVIDKALTEAANAQAVANETKSEFLKFLASGGTTS